jgi:predicted Zn finger-like uncharacterized protein
MEVSCPACAARYTADDSKLRGKTARMRCRACDTVWLVSGPSSASSVEQASDLDNTAPRAAVQRRGAERERRDLFASRPIEEGGVKETLRPPPPYAGTSGVAARNENSVLFKVSDVLGSGGVAGVARVKTPEPSFAPPSSFAPASASPGSYPTPGKDDSGIIDLKALSTAPPAPNRAPAPMLFGAPTSEPPPAFARDVAASSSFYPQQAGAAQNAKLRSIGMIAAGFAVVALCGLGVALAFGGSNPPPKEAAAAPAPPPPSAPPPVATTPPAPEPAPAAAASESKEEKKVSSGKKHHRGGKGGAKASSGVITSKSPPPPPPAKVKPADPCGCHGDFNCILACTAGKK